MNDADRFSVALSQVSGKRLTYAEVTGKVGGNDFLSLTVARSGVQRRKRTEETKSVSDAIQFTCPSCGQEIVIPATEGAGYDNLVRALL